MSLFRKTIEGFFSRLANKEKIEFTSGEILSVITKGEHLVDGKETWEHAVTGKHNIELMKRCCEAELKKMKLAKWVAAPAYFQRVAILSRKEKNYLQEIEYCELYIHEIDEFYSVPEHLNHADVRKGPVYKAIVSRLPKARQLLAESTKQ